MDLINVVIRAITSLTVLFLITKLLGKKQVSELSLFDYVIGISIGNFAAEMTINIDSPFLHGIIAVIVFGIIAYLIDLLSLKSKSFHDFFMGKPTIIIDRGKIEYENMKKINYDLYDLLSDLRKQGYFDLNNINYAILENNGDLSILPKEKYSMVTKEDLNIKKEDNPIKYVIIDGRFIDNQDKKLILEKLKEENKRLDNVLVASIDQKKKINFYFK